VHFYAASPWTAIFILKVVVVLAVCAAIAFWSWREHSEKRPFQVVVPDVLLKISNHGDTDVLIQNRGDFILWFPGLGTAHTFGKYHLHSLKNEKIEQLVTVIPPKTTTSLRARILDQDTFSKPFEHGDCEIDLILRRVDGSHVPCQLIPFTRAALTTYFVSADVSGEKPGQGNPINDGASPPSP